MAAGAGIPVRARSHSAFGSCRLACRQEGPWRSVSCACHNAPRVPLRPTGPGEPGDASCRSVSEHRRQLQVRAAETRLLYENANTGTAVTVIIASLLAYAQWDVVPRVVVRGLAAVRAADHRGEIGARAAVLACVAQRHRARAMERGVRGRGRTGGSRLGGRRDRALPSRPAHERDPGGLRRGRCHARCCFPSRSTAGGVSHLPSPDRFAHRLTPGPRGRPGPRDDGLPGRAVHRGDGRDDLAIPPGGRILVQAAIRQPGPDREPPDRQERGGSAEPGPGAQGPRSHGQADRSRSAQGRIPRDARARAPESAGADTVRAGDPEGRHPAGHCGTCPRCDRSSGQTARAPRR